MQRCLALACWLVCFSIATITAQTPTPASPDVAGRWSAIFNQVMAEKKLTLVDASGSPATGAAAVRLGGTDEQRRDAYEEAVRRLVADAQLASMFTPTPAEVEALISERTDPSQGRFVQDLAGQVPREKGAKSANAASTNPAAPAIAERSGFTDLIALALDAKNFIAANEAAVTININAFALVGLNSEEESAQALYRKHGALRRIAGSFTFGAKLPEGEITGLTGLPSAQNILDAVAWDVKYRIVGDRDPRARRWYQLLIGHNGGLTQLAALLLASPSILSADRPLVREVLNDSLIGPSVASAKAQLERSGQVTFKTGGQHLTKETGKNKYTWALLADKGFGDTDLTGNLSYAIVDDVTISPGSVFTLKTWSGAVAVNQLVAKNRLAEGRAIELSLDAKFELPVDKNALSIDRKNVWKVVGKVALPLGDAATIPVSITYASDPNNLSKEKYFTGHIGISYDFSDVKKLFQPKTATK